MKIEKLDASGNHQIVVDSNKVTFFSYGKEAARVVDGQIELIEGIYNYSKTTSKWLNSFFLGADSKTVKARIKSGEYKVVNA